MPTALITGATAGLGAAFARRLAADGFSLVLVARDAHRLAETAETLSRRYGAAVETLAADLATEEGLERAESRIRDGVDLLINNAGFGHGTPFLSTPAEAEVTMLRLHCEAVLRLTLAALPVLRARCRGGIVNVASVAAFFNHGSYSASKAWVVNFTESVAAETDGSRVKVMALCPGFVRTEFHERASMDVSGIPEFLWLDADRVAAAALRDLARGVTVSVPGALYKTIVSAGRLLPRQVRHAVNARLGR